MAALGPAMRVITSPAKLRESHHRVLRLVAVGYSHREIAARTGYTRERVSQIVCAPAAQSEILRLRGEIERKMIDTLVEEDLSEYELDQQTRLLAKAQRLDRLLEADTSGELLSVKDYNSIIADLEDRYGTPRKSTNVNVHANMGNALEEAIRRSESVTIDQPKVAAE